MANKEHICGDCLGENFWAQLIDKIQKKLSNSQNGNGSIEIDDLDEEEAELVETLTQRDIFDKLPNRNIRI